MDTLAYAKRLRSAGVPEEQAEAHAQVLREATETNLASKQDVNESTQALRHELNETEARLHHKINEAVLGLRNEIADLKAELMKWMFGIAGAQVVLVVTLVKLLWVRHRFA